ncbi:hypothetical protein CDD82_7326 [Ophiocordyceps australis]|uniref:Thioredoxin domain-containing protein n=1 Tax=Ophiocordyceps australis TaxID=1399860 RepID=A0A2C5Y287_9HYPO|nr:hypothetical protein CDD82_7326 [Ophiocordyceps australis]
MAQPSCIKISSEEQFEGLLQSSRLVIADFYADWCGPCTQIAPLYETLAGALTRPNLVTFVKIDSDANRDLAKRFSISVLPTFLIFRDGVSIERVQGANAAELRRIVESLDVEFTNLALDSGGAWSSVQVPRGYTDLTEEIEIRNCELLNADEDFGPVKTLFDPSKPSALTDNAHEAAAAAKDWVQSGADDQLLLYVPFQSTVRLHTLQLTSLPPKDQEAITRPEVIRLYINRTQNLDFGEADDTEPTQTITLAPDDWNEDGTANIGLRYVKFQKTTTLILYVQKGQDGAESVRLDRLKLIGEASTKREMGKLQKKGDE